MRASSVRAIAHANFTRDDEPSQHEATPSEGVRRPPLGLEAISATNRIARRPAHPSNRLVAQLNGRWRVIDDPLQWILQRKKGNPRKKNSGWQGRSFCRTRDALVGCVARHCGEIDENSLAKLNSLPNWHPDWDRRDDSANLDVHEIDQVRADAQSDPLIFQGSGVVRLTVSELATVNPLSISC